MIESLEQQIINSINFRWRKDQSKRIEIDIDSISECFRIICSTRTTTLLIINDIKNEGLSDINLKKLKDNLNWIYNWITYDSIQTIYANYKGPIKNKKKMLEYLNEIPIIEDYFLNFQMNLVKITIPKLLKFYNIKEDTIK
ncbi:hypothetical protein K5V21_03755 [Clostridium sardiniense]|uniref:Uncharacterized protein n=1 Tax=Clostridium sardiniense TaxID=29369 RepID=A0ABS7KUT3_CLOSR|nr:hypothetical protein [Clostridium sardiniense]MBY0754566.1 hypothetical protein [Clostridium sardiniense]MDQ0460833.1 hypothetical protein [Clostridium sardiniense]